MKRLCLIALFAGALVCFGQEHAPATEGAKSQAAGEQHHEEESDPRAGLKWANFAILAVIMGWALAKTLPGVFKSRSEEIASGIAEAAKLKAEADAKSSAIEARLATLATEIEGFRASAKQEMQAEADRIKRETETFLAKIHDGALAEIEAAAKASRAQLKAYSAERALDLAESKIRAGIGSGEGLVDRFISDLARKGANN